MGSLKSKSLMCPVDQHCSEWARKYMGYCLCGTKDWFSLALGLVSVVSWGVAEIPQLITNFKSKSAEGLSILFLMTWIVGDFLNLFGCILEPATLPTQYYMAVLYTITTVLLFAQAVYYGYVYPRLKTKPKRRQEAVEAGAVERKMEQSYGVDTVEVNNIERREVVPSSPIPVASLSPNSNRSEELFFMSARSLSVSHTPPKGSFLASRPPTSDVERHFIEEPLLGDVLPRQSGSPPKLKTMLCVVSLMTLFLGSCNQQLTESRINDMIFKSPTRGVVLHVGRQLFEAKATRGSAEVNGIGSYLGWGMAAIYMGGRLPQICLNIRRGNAEISSLAA
ncbi:hypothetical protein OROMI_028530 [Orobanche minor]